MLCHHSLDPLESQSGAVHPISCPSSSLESAIVFTGVRNRIIIAIAKINSAIDFNSRLHSSIILDTAENVVSINRMMSIVIIVSRNILLLRRIVFW